MPRPGSSGLETREKRNIGANGKNNKKGLLNERNAVAENAATGGATDGGGGVRGEERMKYIGVWMNRMDRESMVAVVSWEVGFLEVSVG